MRYYSFFPGCSLETSAQAYDRSLRAVSRVLGIDLFELDNWNCCGSTPYGSLEELPAFSAMARNLALAEARGLDLVTPCSSCYINLNKTNSYLREYPELKAKVDECLAAGNLAYRGTVKTRHLLEVMVNDIGLEAINAEVKRELKGLKVAPYYGCQIVRPKLGFDDPELPQSLDRLVESLGAEASPFPLKARCCGGSLIISEENLALGLIRKLLESAAENGAQCVVTVCPLCQLNLDAYQSTVNRKFKTKFELPILFFTQLMGIAFGIEEKELGLKGSIVSPMEVLAPYRG